MTPYPQVVKNGQALVLISIVITLTLIGIACSFLAPRSSTKASPTQDPTPTEKPNAPPDPTSTLALPTPTHETNVQLHQWVVAAVDGQDSEESAYATGEPDSEGCELMPRQSVWVYQSGSYPLVSNFLQLLYAEPILPSQVNIHLTYLHSAITQVSLIDLDGEPHKISGAPQKTRRDVQRL